ncbi:ArsR/SmtB family transcription factor [Streptomyces sp. NPDC059037]|uniref:ArsR/SmtB family transcription factor n=1 Tax=Streptomyces sp. NPDC059037 TaxID=3346710 RepID=UPI003689ACB4
MSQQTTADGAGPDLDKVFKALADRTRRHLLDLLREQNGQTLGELCERVEMTRQSATQHLGILEAANLVSTVRRGREKLHYLNPVPLHEIQERWIDRFEQPRLRALGAIKRQAEDATMSSESTSTKPSYVYVTYIESTPDKVWHALTDADLTAAYWGHSNVSDGEWKAGSGWAHRRIDGSGIDDVVGTVVESVPPTRLVTTWGDPNDRDTEPSRVTFDIQPHGGIVRLTVTHENLASEQDLKDVGSGWPAVLSNLKSLLETGSPLPQEPWLVPEGK